MNWLTAFLLSYTGEAALLIFGPCLLCLGFRTGVQLPTQTSLARNLTGIVCIAVGLAAIAFAMHGVIFHSQLLGAHA